MNDMMMDLALTGFGFGLGAGIAAGFLGYTLNLSFKLLKNFSL